MNWGITLVNTREWAPSCCAVRSGCFRALIPNVCVCCSQRPRDEGDHDTRDGGGHLCSADPDRDRRVRGARPRQARRNRGGLPGRQRGGNREALDLLDHGGDPGGWAEPAGRNPNPGTGTGDPLLVRALLPQSSSGREAVFLLPPAVVALPDRDRSSLFIGLRQYSSPVIGPQVCASWTAGLWMLAVTSFNRPRRAAGGHRAERADARGPAVVLGGDHRRPAFGAQRHGLAAALGLSHHRQPALLGRCQADRRQRARSGSRRVQAFEVTGTGKVPLWQWAEVVPGAGLPPGDPDPDQSADADPGAALATITASAYSRAAAVLSLFLLDSGHDCPAQKMATAHASP